MISWMPKVVFASVLNSMWLVRLPIDSVQNFVRYLTIKCVISCNKHWWSGLDTPVIDRIITDKILLMVEIKDIATSIVMGMASAPIITMILMAVTTGEFPVIFYTKKTEIAISVFSLEFQSWVLCWVLHVLITMITFTNDFTQSPKNWFLVKNLYNDSKCTYGPLQIWKLTYIVFFQIR